MQRDSASDTLSRAMAAARDGQWEGARNLFFDVIDRDPRNLEAWLWLGAIAEDPEESVAYLRRALEINPQSVRAQKGMEWAQERLATQQSNPQSAPSRAPEPPPVTLPGVDTSRLQPLTQPLSSYPAPPPAPAPVETEAAGESPGEALDWDSIVQRLRAADGGSGATGENPPAGPATASPVGAAAPAAGEMVQRGKQQLEAGQVADAVTSLREAVRIDPNNVEAYEQLGLACYQAGSPAEALSAFQSVTRLRPDHAEAHANVGFLQSEMGQPDAAIQSLQAALSYRTDMVEALVSLGDLLRGQGRVDEAIGAWERALALRPELSDVRANLESARASRSGRL